MRRLATLVAVLLVPQAPISLLAQTSTACTGLCLQQVSCPTGQTTSISGTIYAPNGTDPLPNVLVYIPNAPVDPFTSGVSCPTPGQPPSGSPLVGASTAADGTFTLTNVPVGSNIPIVIQSGRWRRQLVVPGTVACTNTSFSSRMPKNRTEGDIPHIAIATGDADQVECVLRKVGIDDAEFTNPLDPGRIHLYSGSNRPGARIDTNTPSEDALMGALANLSQYDVLMLPCEGAAFNKPSGQLANLIQYANAGGRVYASHFSYDWMFNNPPFNTVVNWAVNQATLPDGIATVDTSFPDGQTLAQWLQLVGATTTQGQMPVSVLRHDLNGVVAPTQSWLTLNDTAHNNPVMQFTFDTPIGAQNQCGRVLFNEYHVENPPSDPANKSFPTECPNAPMTPQEKLLEYGLFNLTSEGGEPTLSPTTYDFGSEPVGFTTAPQPFTFKNTSIFALTISNSYVTGDFVITSNNCSSVAAGATCIVNVAFRPTALGSRTGTLTVVSSAKTLTSTLTGTGTAALSVAPTSLNFGNVDVGATSTRSVTVTNPSPGAVATPSLLISGDYAVASTCGASIPAGTSCALNITFKPAATGSRTGTLTVASGDPAIYGLPVQLTGNGVDFSIALNPTSGNLISGRTIQTTATLTPIAGYGTAVTISCTTTAPASTCASSLLSVVPAPAPTPTISITTTSRYTVIGYGSIGGPGLFSLIALVTGALLLLARRRAPTSARIALFALLLAALSFSATGCSGKYPSLNNPYTPAGTYTYTVSATDGFLTHTATYTLTLTDK